MKEVKTFLILNLLEGKAKLLESRPEREALLEGMDMGATAVVYKVLVEVAKWYANQAESRWLSNYVPLYGRTMS